MRQVEGLRVTLIDESLLDATGVLQGAAGCALAYGLPDESVRLFLLIAASSPDGLLRSKLPKDLIADLEVHLIPLEMQELVAWERDGRGRPTYLVLTWKGEEALAAARPRPSSMANRVAARRRSVNSGESC